MASRQNGWGADFAGKAAALCERADAVLGSPPEIDAIRQRQAEPLRVAIAGRVKAGKSTLLNAIIGERLAPTDASECTRIVTWYREGVTYEVSARLRSGGSRQLGFSRERGSLDIDLGGLSEADVAAIDVVWPSSRLRHMTLVDTPGSGGMDEERATRARELFGGDARGPSEVDAVIYLMRHMHHADAAFLEAFTDRSVAQPSPVNAVAVLSRADEIGAGRLDALASARRIAERYAVDGRVTGLAATVVPVAGLVAQAGRTVAEHEALALAELARGERAEVESLLLSADRFLAPDETSIAAESRAGLLDALGMFGLRFAIDAYRRGTVGTGSELSQALVAESGLETLLAVLDGHFRSRATVLKARSTLANLKAHIREHAAAGRSDVADLLAEIEEVETSSHVLAELRLTALLLSGQVDLAPDERAEVTRLLAAGSTTERLGADEGTSAEDMMAQVVDRLEVWRRRAAHPLADHLVQEAASIVVRSFEGLHADLRSDLS